MSIAINSYEIELLCTNFHFEVITRKTSAGESRFHTQKLQDDENLVNGNAKGPRHQ